MLKLVGTNGDGTVADEKVLITDDGKPTKFLIGIALIELALDLSVAILLGKTVFRKRVKS